MGLFSRKRDEPENAATGGDDVAFEVVDAAGNRIRYTPDDFDEIFTTADEREMRRTSASALLSMSGWAATPAGPPRGSTLGSAAPPGACAGPG